MDIFLALLGLFFVIIGLLGAILPILPGPPISWLGLLCVYGIRAIPNNLAFIFITLAIAMMVTVLDYVIPVLGTKKFGGTKKGIWGSTLGLIVGLFFPPFGIILGPLLGAFVGELLENTKNYKKALKAAIGSFIGFLLSTGLKLIVCIVYLYYYFKQVWLYKSDIFSI